MILFITRKYPPSVGGMQRLSYRLTTEVSKQADARVISWGRGEWGLPLFYVWAFIRALVVLMRGQVELIHLSDPVLCPLGCLLGTLGRVPVVVTVHGLDIVYTFPAYQAMVRRCLRRMDRLVCISQHTRIECIQRGMSARSCVVIPPGVDPGARLSRSAPEMQSLAARWGVDLSGRRVLLTTGRLVPRKGVAHFVSEALPQLLSRRGDWLYLVAGEGAERARIEEAAARHGLSGHVRMLGAISDAELWAAYCLADVFVMPNVPVAGNPEGFGIVVTEARAAGTPAVAADLEGIREAAGGVEDSTLVPPADWSAFVEAIDRWLEREEGGEAREQRRQRVMAQLAWPQIAARYLAVFGEAVHEHRQKGEEQLADRG